MHLAALQERSALLDLPVLTGSSTTAEKQATAFTERVDPTDGTDLFRTDSSFVPVTAWG